VIVNYNNLQQFILVYVLITNVRVWWVSQQFSV